MQRKGGGLLEIASKNSRHFFENSRELSSEYRKNSRLLDKAKKSLPTIWRQKCLDKHGKQSLAYVRLRNLVGGRPLFTSLCYTNTTK